MDGEIQVQEGMSQEEPAMGFGGRLVNIFVSPRKTFEAINKKPSWLGPLVLFLLIAVTITQISLPVIMKVQKEKIFSDPAISEQQKQAMEPYFVVNTGARVRTLAGQVIVTPIFYLALAGILFLVGTVFLGGDTTYKKVLSVVSWSWIIMALSTIIVMLLAMQKGSMDFSLSPALFMPADTIGTKIYTLASKFDFFTIWFLAILAAGFGYIYKFSNAKAYTTVGILWAIWIGISVAFSGVLKQFGM